APYREADLLELAHVSAPGVDDETAHAVRLIGRAEQLTEHSIGVRATQRDDDDVAGLTQLDCDVQHPVVTRMSERRDRAAGNPCTWVNRAHGAVQQPCASLRLVHGGD